MLKDILYAARPGDTGYSGAVLCFFDDDNNLCGCEATNTDVHLQIGKQSYEMAFVNAKEIKPFVKKSSKIAKVDNELVIDDKRFAFIEPPHGFPLFGSYDGWGKHIVGLDQLDRVASTTYYDLRTIGTYYTSGVLYKDNDLVGTDGHRMRIERVTEHTKHDDFLIQSYAIKILTKVIKPVGDIEFYYDECNRIMFVSENVRMCVSTIDVRFPDYYRIIPEDAMYTVTVDSKPLITALKELEKIFKKSEEKNYTVRIDFGLSKLFIGKNKLSYKKVTEDGYKHRNEDRDVEWEYEFDQWTPICYCIPNDIQITMNVKYLLEALERSSDTAKIIWNGKHCPLQVNSDNGMEIIMPIRMD